MNCMTAYCGLDCEKCDARIATISDDDALREKTAARWSKMNGIEITKEMINCAGCRADGVKTIYCESLCQIRQCAMKNGFATCGECNLMERCEKLMPITGTNDAAKNRLKNFER